MPRIAIVYCICSCRSHKDSTCLTTEICRLNLFTLSILTNDVGYHKIYLMRILRHSSSHSLDLLSLRMRFSANGEIRVRLVKTSAIGPVFLSLLSLLIRICADNSKGELSEIYLESCPPPLRHSFVSLLGYNPNPSTSTPVGQQLATPWGFYNLVDVAILAHQLSRETCLSIATSTTSPPQIRWWNIQTWAVHPVQWE